jgi:hypothetical protein
VVGAVLTTRGASTFVCCLSPAAALPSSQSIFPKMPAQNRPEAIAVDVVERRRYPRENRPAPVKVCVQASGEDVEFQAVLVNSSRGGVAIRHWRKDLMLGSHVKVSITSGEEIEARVKWNWISGPLVISGLERVAKSEICTTAAGRHGHVATSVPSASRALAAAALAGLLLVMGWYLKTRIL